MKKETSETSTMKGTGESNKSSAKEIIISGFGGQGVLSMGKILAYSALMEGKEVTWMPAYGPEQRGGTANVTVIVSDSRISSPILSRYDVAVVLNQPSLEKFEPKLKPGGILIYDTYGITNPPKRNDINIYRISAMDKAAEMHNAKVFNMIVLGGMLRVCPVVGKEGLRKALLKTLPERHHRLIPLNMQAVDQGMQIIRETTKQPPTAPPSGHPLKGEGSQPFLQPLSKMKGSKREVSRKALSLLFTLSLVSPLPFPFSGWAGDGVAPTFPVCTTVSAQHSNSGTVVANVSQASEKGVIKGQVFDSANQEPMIGVTVSVEGTSNGVVTDLDGNFTLTLPTTGKTNVVFNFIGYQRLMMSYDGTNGASFRHIVMKPEAVDLKDVVITGIYRRTKESFTGSSSTFKGSELKSVGAQNVLQSLRTLDPSFKIMENNLAGSNPNTMPDVEIRGKSSVAGLKEEYGTDPNQPLFILDGFETTIETVMNLNMNRVASVTLLKDAASTAIYGSKAANGVVVIETKTPEHGRLQLSYKGDYSLEFADLSDYNLMNSREKLRFEELAGVYKDNTGNPFNQIKLDNLRNSRLHDIEEGVDTYWLSVPLRTGFTHKHNLYAEGGENNIRYGIGLNYGKTLGVMKGSDRQTLGGNLDLIYRTGKFQFSNKLTIDYQETNDPAVSFSEYANANPYYRKYGEDGKINKYLYYPEDGLNDSPVPNPLWNAHLNNYDMGQRTGFTNNFIAEWFATNELRFRAKFGITKYDDTQDTRLSPDHSSFDDKEATQKGLFTHSLLKALYYEGDVSATYGKIFADKHQLNAVFGFNFNSTDNKTYGYSATGFTDDQFAAPSFANSYPDGGKSKYSESVKHASSFYLNGGYAYDNRYLLDFNLRSDGASMFGTDNRFRTTWSVGLGWNLHNEKWMKERDLFQLLKLRASVGNPGNQNFSAYQAFTTYMFSSLMSNVFGTGVIINGLGNKDLAWQETINYNIGADITTLQSRLNVTLDYYIKNTDPLLAIITTPGSMGVTSEALNAGKQKTTGWEATVKYSPIYMPEERINWNVAVSATHSKSKYADIGNAFSALNESGKSSLHGTTRYYDGGSPTAIWAVRSAGIDPSTGKELFIKRDGTYSFTYDTTDEVVCGDTEPDVEGLLSTTLYYKGFSFSCYFRYEVGGQQFNSSLFDKVENIGTADVYNNQDRRALYDRWSADNRNALFKGISMVQKTDKSSRFVMDDNTLTCESVNIGYEFPLSIAKKFGMQALTVQASMNELFRWSTIKAERGISYPFARTVSFSIGATF